MLPVIIVWYVLKVEVFKKKYFVWVQGAHNECYFLYRPEPGSIPYNRIVLWEYVLQHPEDRDTDD
jgi:hypothetical protein